MKPIKWDGTALGADRVLDRLPARTVSYWGAGPETELYLHDKTGSKELGKAKPGDLIGINEKGDACVVRSR